MGSLALSVAARGGLDRAGPVSATVCRYAHCRSPFHKRAYDASHQRGYCSTACNLLDSGLKSSALTPLQAEVAEMIMFHQRGDGPDLVRIEDGVMTPSINPQANMRFMFGILCYYTMEGKNSDRAMAALMVGARLLGCIGHPAYDEIKALVKAHGQNDRRVRNLIALTLKREVVGSRMRRLKGRINRMNLTD